MEFVGKQINYDLHSFFSFLSLVKLVKKIYIIVYITYIFFFQRPLYRSQNLCSRKELSGKPVQS